LEENEKNRLFTAKSHLDLQTQKSVELYKAIEKEKHDILIKKMNKGRKME